VTLAAGVAQSEAEAVGPPAAVAAAVHLAEAAAAVAAVALEAVALAEAGAGNAASTMLATVVRTTDPVTIRTLKNI
jgi:hypothetical protein